MLPTLVSFFILGALAIPYPSAIETPPGYETLGWTHMPTLSPLVLLKRDVGPICGSNLGKDGTRSALPCDDDGYTCFRDISLTAIGCCPSADAGYSSCRIYTTCLHDAQTCLEDCLNNPLIKLCSSPTPSCGTWRWPGGGSSYHCDTILFSVNVLSPAAGSLALKRAPATKTSAAVQQTPTHDLREPTSTPKNVAAIVGGVLGGVLLLCVLGIVGWVLRRNKMTPNGIVPISDPNGQPAEMPTDVTNEFAEMPVNVTDDSAEMPTNVTDDFAEMPSNVTNDFAEMPTNVTDDFAEMPARTLQTGRERAELSADNDVPGKGRGSPGRASILRGET